MLVAGNHSSVSLILSIYFFLAQLIDQLMNSGYFLFLLLHLSLSGSVETKTVSICLEFTNLKCSSLDLFSFSFMVPCYRGVH